MELTTGDESDEYVIVVRDLLVRVYERVDSFMYKYPLIKYVIIFGIDKLADYGINVV